MSRTKNEGGVPDLAPGDADLTSPDLAQTEAGFDGPEPDTQVGPDPLARAASDESWDGPTSVGTPDEMAELAAASVTHVDEAPEGVLQDATEAGASAAAEASAAEASDVPPVAPGRLGSIVESLLFASERPLTTSDLKRLLGERDTAKVNAALDELRASRQETGVQLTQVAGGWHLRTNPENVAWVSRILTGKPPRLSRAMLETLAIVAYRQPITRPEVDEIRGVDCGPVIKTLLERGLVRMIGKKEDVGRPILYGTTPEFLRTFSLRDLTELPTLREFHELSADELAKVDAAAPAPAGNGAPAAPTPIRPPPSAIHEVDPAEEEALLADLDRATAAAAQAAAPPPTEAPVPVEDESVG